MELMPLAVRAAREAAPGGPVPDPDRLLRVLAAYGADGRALPLVSLRVHAGLADRARCEAALEALVASGLVRPIADALTGRTAAYALTEAGRQRAGRA